MKYRTEAERLHFKRLKLQKLRKVERLAQRMKRLEFAKDNPTPKLHRVKRIRTRNILQMMEDPWKFMDDGKWNLERGTIHEIIKMNAQAEHVMRAAARRAEKHG